jgi:hypothetical protein
MDTDSENGLMDYWIRGLVDCGPYRYPTIHQSIYPAFLSVFIRVHPWFYRLSPFSTADYGMTGSAKNKNGADLRPRRLSQVPW